MIYTVTLNPSVDFIVEVEDFQLDGLNRMSKEAKYPGGKGINVSRILKRIDVDNTALGFYGGFPGEFILDALRKEGVKADFIQVDEDSRINIKLKTGHETEINGLGPAISSDKMNDLIKKLEGLTESDILILSGSIPPSMPKDLYQEWTRSFAGKGISVVVDTSGKALLDVVKEHPFLVKPNHHELGELFDKKIDTADDAIHYGKILVEQGAQNVIVSMAGDGALLINKEEVYSATIPQGTVKNSTGAGDSLVAGFIGKWDQTKDLLQAFQYGVASGSATAFNYDLAEKQDIEALLPQVHITKI
ncbi:1-phosphofructokinase [Pradoshia eiseniae]|uniref:Tagatose-6-phosphate kinase n=1 Tax=Pradoshia eiseniae TaxID=2064768 RepID=A0A2S7N3H5_9BACI|nr:1-phosphofructokinase [Pradoshia eiseniae]PQD96632.1 1-phosphofructokinase [Pradoshia eiseniae]